MSEQPAVRDAAFLHVAAFFHWRTDCVFLESVTCALYLGH